MSEAFLSAFWTSFPVKCVPYKFHQLSIGQFNTICVQYSEEYIDVSVFALQEEVWGVAYRIPVKQEVHVRRHLDFREVGGYQTVYITFHPADSNMPPFELDIYVGTPSNPFFAGPAPLTDIAHQICSSVGPSGRNDEYLFRLADAMRIIAPHVFDHHLFKLEREVRKLQSASDSNYVHALWCLARYDEHNYVEHRCNLNSNWMWIMEDFGVTDKGCLQNVGQNWHPSPLSAFVHSGPVPPPACRRPHLDLRILNMTA